MSQSTVLVVEDDQSLREALHDTLEIAGYSVTTAEDGNAALRVLEQEEVSMVVSDVQMEPMDGYTLLKKIKNTKGDLPVMLMTAYGDIQKAVQAMHEGAVDYLVKPFEAEVLVNMVERYIRQPEPEETDFITHDSSTLEVKEIAKRVADTEATVLISGDSGTGKEVLARFIHNNSPRVNAPFIAINCAAIPDNMLEATLFGYEKGAFTGAYNACPGKFEQANGGTLLLDEISEMDMGLQAKLLRVLQEREVERLGGRKVIELDVRVLATTNRVLKDEVATGNFREDLFYRLNVFPMYLKPLRERTADILPLAERIVERIAIRSSRPVPEFSRDAKHYLKTNPWPGNVRELDNMMQRALVLQRGNLIDVDDILFEHIDVPSVLVKSDEDDTHEGLSGDLKSREQDIILESLRESGGSRKKTSEKLGISPRTLRYKLARMREAGVQIPGDVGTETA